MNRPNVLIIALAFAVPAGAQAHVAATPSTTTPGAYTAVAFRVGHGCDGKATTALRIEIPAALAQVRPRAIAGWRIAIEKTPDGRTSAVTWRGRLPEERFETFELLFKAPDQPGPLYFPAIQTCAGAEAQWTEIPGPGAGPGGLSHPAPAVTVIPGDGAPAHH